MKPLHIVVIVGFLLALYGVGNLIVTYNARRSDAQSAFEAAKEKAQSAKSENEALQDELEYLSKEANLAKEIRSRFNYKKPDEKMLIIVPSASSTTNEQQ